MPDEDTELDDTGSSSIAKGNFVESSIKQALKIKELEKTIQRLEESSK